MPVAQICAYLGSLGWAGSVHELKEALEPISHLVDYLTLLFDVDERVSPKLGFECQFDNVVQPQDEPRWLALLDYLVSQELCTRQKRDALLAYPGISTELSAADSWPAEVRQNLRRSAPGFISILKRGLSHVKIAYQPQSPLVAKVYLHAIYGQRQLGGFDFLWMFGQQRLNAQRV
jgi:hypothetical protein